MSRKLAVLLVGAPGAASADEAALIRQYEAITSVVVKTCARPQSDREIVVCARRQADRYRVPYVEYDVGDPRGESVSAERNRLASTPKVPCGRGAIIANCGGGVGVSTSVAFGAGAFGALKLRPLAE